MINESAIKCFLVLCDTLSFTETSKQLFMTQQAVSKQIAKMEEDLGFQLFQRTHHYVMLTRAGENFRNFFASYQEEFSRVCNTTKAYYDNLYNSLNFGYLEWLEISDSISAALHQLKQETPTLKFTGEKHPQYELNERFMSHKLDLIITYKEFAPKATGLKSLKILDTPLVLLAAPDYNIPDPEPDADSFRHEPFIKAAASTESLSESKARARKQCADLQFEPSDIIISPNLESAYMATEFGQGVLVSTMLSRMSLHSELKCYDLGVNEELLCFWHEDEENPTVSRFASILEKLHNA